MPDGVDHKILAVLGYEVESNRFIKFVTAQRYVCGRNGAFILPNFTFAWTLLQLPPHSSRVFLLTRQVLRRWLSQSPVNHHFAAGT